MDATRLERAAPYYGVDDHSARHGQAAWLPGGRELCQPQSAFTDRRCRFHRADRRRAADRRLADAAGRLHYFGRNGVRLFHGACAEELLPADQRRHAGDHVLLHLSVPFDRRARSLERRRRDEARLRGRTMDTINATFARFEPLVHSIFRVITGLLLFQFGVAKLFKFPPGTMFDKVEPFSLFWIAGSIELVLGGLLILGLFSRIVAFILCGEMAFAYFIEHFPRGFIPLLNGGENAIMFCFACLYLACAGGGPYSLGGIVWEQG